MLVYELLNATVILTESSCVFPALSVALAWIVAGPDELAVNVMLHEDQLPGDAGVASDHVDEEANLTSTF
jgi:hypothetical protein